VGYTLSNKSQEERDAFWQKLGTGLGNGASNFAANPMAVMQQSNMLKYVAVYVLFKVAASIFRSRLERAAGRTEDAQVPVARNTKEAKGGKKKRKWIAAPLWLRPCRFCDLALHYVQTSWEVSFGEQHTQIGAKSIGTFLRQVAGRQHRDYRAVTNSW
jgi:hypothetical protein